MNSEPRYKETGKVVRLLLVEDNLRLQQLLAGPLRQAGYGLDAVGTMAELLSSVAVVQYDLIILDLGLPDGDGVAVIRKLRTVGNSTPILIITARGRVEDRVVGLDSGADDYLIKPFNHAELLARVRAILRRPSQPRGRVLKFGKVELDEAQGKVSCSGQPIDLKWSERHLLSVLMHRNGRLVPKSMIADAFSEAGRELSSNAVEILVSRLRKALIEDFTGVTVEAVRSVGYRLRSNEMA